MENTKLKFGTFFWRVTSSHMVTYLIMGLIASNMLDYQTTFSQPPLNCFMKPLDSVWITMGPVLQVFRGLIFSVALWWVKESFLDKPYGWLKLWILVMGLSILSTTGAAPGSVEGIIYTKIPVADQLRGYIEVMPQTLLFSLAVYYWYQKPGKAWNIISILCVSLIALFAILGLLFTP